MIKILRLDNYRDTRALYIFADLRGFSQWSKDYPAEIRELLEITYSITKHFFEATRKPEFKKKSEFKKKLVKFLGDGFFAINEYDRRGKDSLSLAVRESTNDILDFIDNFNTYIERSSLHLRHHIGIGFGVAYGHGYRFNMPGFPTDYVGAQINIAARLCKKAESSEVIFEHDLSEYLQKTLHDRVIHFLAKDDFLDLKEFPNYKVYRVTDVYQLLRRSPRYAALERLMQQIERQHGKR